MSSTLFNFGEHLPPYEIPVLNERIARAGAGILLVIALIAFMNAWLIGNFIPTQVFVSAFLLDFTIRLFINPRYAPTLIVGQWLVRKQQPEYTSAPQKRFAWFIGFGLAVIMYYLIVLNQVIGPVNLLVCALCLILLFFETAFGICLGCHVYNLFHSDKAKHCPGNSCELSTQQRNTVTLAQWSSLFICIALIGVIFVHFNQAATIVASSAATMKSPMVNNAEAERCKVPEFAKAMGHEEKWKLHNHCL